MRITPLASGSSGNSYVLQCNGNTLLVDAGLTAKQICLRLESAEVDPHSLNAILVSHGHSDHVKGVGVLSRRFKIPVWMNRGTWKVAKNQLGALHALEHFETGRIFELAGFKVHPFSVPHDCADPVGFRISKGTCRVGIATDLGVPTGLVANLLAGTQVLVLESNHDPRMLMEGPYPWELKQRVRGRLGHLSNQDTARLLQRIVSDELQSVILAHMSQTNNRAELALDCVRDSLREFLAQRGTLCCASQDRIGPTVEW